MAKKILKIDFDYDFALYGIITVEKSHRLCWLLRKELDFNFKRIEDLELMKLNKIISFTRYKYENIHSDNDATCYLIANKNSGYFVIPERKETDYFLIIKNLTIEGILNKLKKINNLQAVFTLNPNDLNSKENLIF